MQKRRYRKLEDSGVYIDSYELAKVIYHAIFEFPKKDRVVMGDRLMSLAFAMVSDVAMAYRFMERRVEYIDSFIGRYEQLKCGLRMAADLKMFGRWIVWNGARRCFGLKERFRFRERMRRWYRGVA